MKQKTIYFFSGGVTIYISLDSPSACQIVHTIVSGYVVGEQRREGEKMDAFGKTVP